MKKNVRGGSVRKDERKEDLEGRKCEEELEERKSEEV